MRVRCNKTGECDGILEKGIRCPHLGSHPVVTNTREDHIGKLIVLKRIIASRE